MRGAAFSLAIAALFVGLAAAAPAAAQEPVTFEARDGAELSGHLFRPEGPGRHPAVVMMHGCGGILDGKGRIRARDLEWAERFRAAGFVVLIADSFTRRGVATVCTTRDSPITPRRRAGDAAAAAEFLAARKDVDHRRIGLVGWSHGGSTVLHAVLHSKPEGFDYRVVVAFYPGCRGFLNADRSPRRPVTVLHGTEDDWTPIEPCRAFAEKHDAVTMIELPGAHHGFDTPDAPLRTLQAAFSKDGSGNVTFGTHEPSRRRAIAITMRILDTMKPGTR